MALDQLLLPADPGTVGRRTATRSRTESAVTKHFIRFLKERPREVANSYKGHPGLISLITGPHTALQGFCWLINPVGSSVLVGVEAIHLITQQSLAGTSQPIGPRLTVERVTFTGTGSAGLVADSESRTASPDAVAELRTASTGLTLTAGATVCGFFPIMAMTQTIKRTSEAISNVVVWEPEEQCVLAAGEGLVFRQPDVGHTSEGRLAALTFLWQEFTDF